MNKSEQRSQKRKEVVEAVAVRNEPISVVACIFNIPIRIVLGWLGPILNEENRRGRLTLSRHC
ncbi:hypothetical protein [Methylobacter sp.]|uniref:hypothetical protein n=1 Tax=Methylobacter sp. TaxID=2051955 RepID=UPI002FDC7D8C